MHIRSWSLTEAMAKRTAVPQFLAATSGKQISGSESRHSACAVTLERRDTITAAEQKVADCAAVVDWSRELSVPCLGFPFVTFTVSARIDKHVSECVLTGVVIKMDRFVPLPRGGASTISVRVGPTSSILTQEIASNQTEWMCGVYCCQMPDNIEFLRYLEHASLSILKIGENAAATGRPEAGSRFQH